MNPIIYYCLGFAFTPDERSVILIQKKRPEWQKGLFNGIGGKIEKQDYSAHAAMSREFREETGIYTPAEDWRAFGKMLGEGYVCHVFSLFSEHVLEARSMEDETVVIAALDQGALGNGLLCLPNVRALIHHALESRQRGLPFLTLNYTERRA